MFKNIHLENGIPVVMEQIKDVRSVALGIWVKVGSRNEPPERTAYHISSNICSSKEPRSVPQRI